MSGHKSSAGAAEDANLRPSPPRVPNGAPAARTASASGRHVDVWGVALVLLVLLWVAEQWDPDIQEQLDAWRGLFREWYTGQQQAGHGPLPEERPRPMVDETWSRRYRSQRARRAVPHDAVPHPTDPDSYYWNTEEFFS